MRMDAACRWLFIAWAPYGRRSELLARELGAPLHFIHYLKFQSPRYAPAKYILQAIRTLQVLFTKNPDVVFVQSPPFVATLVVYLYCRLHGARVVIDHHTDSFGRKWRWGLPVQKHLARHAITNLVTNQHWAEIIQAWAAEAFVLPDPFVTLPDGGNFVVGPGFNVAFINTFAADEPIEAVVEAASGLPGVHFYITGNIKNRPSRLTVDIPANITFTGFLPDLEYFSLLRAADAVMALTTRDYTLQGGGCEAVSLGKPLITSDWPYLREFFARGTIYVANTGDSIRNGIVRMQQAHQELEREMVAFRLERRREWNGRFALLKELIADHTNPSTPAAHKYPINS